MNNNLTFIAFLSERIFPTTVAICKNRLKFFPTLYTFSLKWDNYLSSKGLKTIRDINFVVARYGRRGWLAGDKNSCQVKQRSGNNEFPNKNLSSNPWKNEIIRIYILNKNYLFFWINQSCETNNSIPQKRNPNVAKTILGEVFNRVEMAVKKITSFFQLKLHKAIK